MTLRGCFLDLRYLAAEIFDQHSQDGDQYNLLECKLKVQELYLNEQVKKEGPADG